jgi:hypothetical protein
MGLILVVGTLEVIWGLVISTTATFFVIPVQTGIQDPGEFQENTGYPLLRV